MRQIILAPNWLRNLVLILLVAGIFFRFYNLDSKVYWHDEVYTSLRISGYTTNQVAQEIFNGRIITKEDFAKFQTFNPQINLADSVKSLAVDDPQHSPLYYIIIRLWVEIFGNSITAIRSLSAVISLLVFPCIYWLCRELFKVPLSVPIIAIALIAVSPIELVFAQEAREYILWIVTTLLSSASLLQAIRLQSQVQEKSSNSFVNWGLYTITLTLSFYTYLLTIFVAIGHGIYVITTNRLNKILKAYLLASLSAIILFLPWIAVFIINRHRFQATTSWTKVPIPLKYLIEAWLLGISRVFVDFNLGLKNPFILIITILILIIIGYSIYFICTRTSRKSWVFVINLIAIPALPLMLADVILGGQRSTSERYLLPSYLGIQIAVSYLLASQLNIGTYARRKTWKIITAIIITLGIISCAVNSQADIWWNKLVSYDNRHVAAIINQAQHPLVISNFQGTNLGNIISLSYLVEPRVRFELVKNDEIPKIPTKYTDIFLFNLSTILQKGIKKQYGVDTIVVFKDKYYSVVKLEKGNREQGTGNTEKL